MRHERVSMSSTSDDQSVFLNDSRSRQPLRDQFYDKRRPLYVGDGEENILNDNLSSHYDHIKPNDYKNRLLLDNNFVSRSLSIFLN